MFTRDSIGKQVVLFVITLGFYGLYWMYKTADQLDRGTSAHLTPVLVIVPFYGLWILADGGEAVTDQSQGVLFLLFLVFGPAAWFLIQSGINEIAEGV
ncbi:DUF4234 domain-containing protein [Salinigranum sp. GCM10025319]|uniref:DUF4234 domain-containing protein n=1 Tax=Salinigranum sp. GCM10025319 TaxID=3252687 RepID=UPI00360E6D76